MAVNTTAETYIFELMVNGTATGLTMTFSPANATINYLGFICFTAEMRVWPQSGSLGGETVVYVIGRLRRFNESNVATGENTVAMRTTFAPGTTAIDTTKDNLLQWRVRHGTGTGDYMNWTNIMCYMPVYGTGA
jgi:hypothetical protein